MKMMMLLINDHGHVIFDDLLVDDLKHPTLAMTFLQRLPTHLNQQRLTMGRQQLSTWIDHGKTTIVNNNNVNHNNNNEQEHDLSNYSNAATYNSGFGLSAWHPSESSCDKDLRATFLVSICCYHDNEVDNLNYGNYNDIRPSDRNVAK